MANSRLFRKHIGSSRKQSRANCGNSQQLYMAGLCLYFRELEATGKFKKSVEIDRRRPSHGRGHRFDPCRAHHSPSPAAGSDIGEHDVGRCEHAVELGIEAARLCLPSCAGDHPSKSNVVRTASGNEHAAATEHLEVRGVQADFLPNRSYKVTLLFPADRSSHRRISLDEL